MIFVGSKRFVAPLVVSSLLAGFTLAPIWGSDARAAPTETPRGIYVIPDHEGYGVLECVIEKKDCGKVVADAWCEAHGHGPALAFGAAGDVTFAIGSTRQASPGAESAVVACRE